MDFIKELMEIGKSLGYKDQELRDFIEKERKAEREREEEKRKREEEKEQQRIQREEEAERQRIKREEEAERPRIKREEEKEQQRLEREERMITREAKTKEEDHKRELALKEKELEILKLKAESGRSESQEKAAHTQVRPSNLKIPKFDETTDDMDIFLERFERFSKAQKWPKEEWSVNLSTLLTGKGLQVFTSVPVDQIHDYDGLKAIKLLLLLKRYQLTQEGFRRKFREEKQETDETVLQFVARLRRYLERWIQLADVQTTFEGLQDLMLREQYMYERTSNVPARTSTKGHRHNDKVG